MNSSARLIKPEKHICTNCNKTSIKRRLFQETTQSGKGSKKVQTIDGLVFKGIVGGSATGQTILTGDKQILTKNDHFKANLGHSQLERGRGQTIFKLLLLVKLFKLKSL